MQHLVVRKRADAHLDEEPIEPEQLVLVENLGRNLVRRPNEVRAARATLGLELLAARRRPAALAPDLRHHIRVRRVRIVGDLPRVVPDQAVRVDAHAQLRRIVPGATARLSVKVDQGHEATRLATDDGKGERQAEPTRAHDRLGMSADRDPYRQGVLNRTRKDR